ncbi:VWA domain-containing protein [Novosphingobium sp. G106]|uniref:vWA domain-containing protein n=1 Tax=Novosphingobium sp. G106 TaxID=2849500 RepID=UPI002811FE6F|nr:VWA domain-containing protein [Novosphingobium sp. G106]
MRTARTLTATCIVALVAGCATSKQNQVGSAEGEDIVVTSQRAQDEPFSSPLIREHRRQADATSVPSPPPPPSAVAPSIAGKAMAPMPRQEQFSRAFVPPVMTATDPGTERYAGKEVSPVHIARNEPVSTFSVDVDTGAYANARRFLGLGQLPPRDAVRSEELINYFRYDYAAPATRDVPFTVTTDVAVTPWNPATRLMRIGLRGYDLPTAGSRPPANLVFLVDVSGSMSDEDKLPLVKSALAGLASELSPKDKVSIVVYAGAAGLVLEPTSDPAKIRAALDRLSAGGSTAGGAGLQLAYNIARDNFIQGGVNRILLATDGDFNVGVSDNKALIEMVEKQRDSGITLTTLGFGQGNYNEAMMEQIADHGNGNYAYIDSALEARKVLGDQMSATLFTIAKDVKIQVEFNPAQVSQYRLIGYENRALREEDFDNDKVDAGDIGAGHQVTAIYEIVPAGAQGWIGPRRYEDAAPSTAGKAGELAFVKLRYKMPDGKTSRLIERPVSARLMQTSARPTGDFAFATAVAAFGQSLRGDAMMNGFTHAQIAALAGRQQDFWRQEFLRLVGVAGSLAQAENTSEMEYKGG